MSELVLLIYARLGLKLYTPPAYRPEQQGIVERSNAVVKRMLHHILAQAKNPRDWHTKLNHIAWAYREVPNATTSLSPVQMVYGRHSRGPLAVIQETWSGLKSNILTVAHDHKARVCLDSLQDELQLAASLAKEHAEIEQQRYLAIHNAYAKEKDFQVGDLVLALMPSSNNKIISTWQGPGTITNIVSKNTYKIVFQNAGEKVLHADLLRKFYTRVNALGVICYSVDKDDAQLGDRELIPILSNASSVSFEEQLGRVDLSHLSSSEQIELRQLLRRFQKVFNDQPGLCKNALHQIDTYPDFVPKAQRTYRIPEALIPEVERQLNDLIQHGKIRPSQSPVAHPLLCVPKANGDVRLCTDMRYINRFTVSSEYHSPRQEDLLNRMSGSRFISILDFSQSFFQIPIREEDKYKTAFKFQSRSYEWNVTPFGLKSSGCIFQATMDSLLAPHHDYAESYVDDVNVHSDAWQSHVIHLSGVLSSILDSGMTLKLSKCQWAQPQVKFLGHLVGSSRLLPLLDKVEAIKGVPEPDSKKKLRGFLSMIGFYRHFIPAFSDIAISLTDLTKKDQKEKLRFNEVERQAFAKLKAILCQMAELHTPDPSKPFVLHCDASDRAIAGALSQQVDGHYKPIAFMSMKLLDCQLSWPIIEKELYAVVQSVKKWEHLLYARKVILYSDHSPLQFVHSGGSSSAKLTRWSLYLMRYDIEARFIAGTSNSVSDFLSRV